MKKVQPADTALVLRSPLLFVAFGFGSGLSKIVPGTVGTLASVPLYLVLAQLPLWAYLFVLVITSALGVAICGRAARQLGVHDHSGIVWDEFVGFWITMLLVPPTLTWIIVGFVLFRFFDMVKPWPISLADKKLDGGFGIMFDDILAGIAACLCLQGLIWVV